jgi:oligoribonuclease
LQGLDINNDTILQIAVIITDGDLRHVVEGPELVIGHTEEALARMNDWCIDQHGRSGLTQACRESIVTIEEAETRILDFVMAHVPDPGTGIVAGNTVHVDVAFLRRQMPRLISHLHYRIVDVSTVGELCRRWYPRDAARAPKKQSAHTALSDIRESIEQLRYYQKAIFKAKQGGNGGGKK